MLHSDDAAFTRALRCKVYRPARSLPRPFFCRWRISFRTLRSTHGAGAFPSCLVLRSSSPDTLSAERSTKLLLSSKRVNNDRFHVLPSLKHSEAVGRTCCVL